MRDIWNKLSTLFLFLTLCIALEVKGIPFKETGNQ